MGEVAAYPARVSPDALRVHRIACPRSAWHVVAGPAYHTRLCKGALLPAR